MAEQTSNVIDFASRAAVRRDQKRSAHPAEVLTHPDAARELIATAALPDPMADLFTG